MVALLLWALLAVSLDCDSSDSLGFVSSVSLDLVSSVSLVSSVELLADRTLNPCAN